VYAGDELKFAPAHRIVMPDGKDRRAG